MKKASVSNILLLFFLATCAQAQFTTVTGTVIDPHSLPYANGTITPTLITTASPTLSGITYAPPSQPVGLSLAGAFVMRLADNTQLQPGGTQWTFKVCSAAGSIQPAGGNGPVCFNVTLTISGSAQDISAQLQAAALPLSNVASGGGGTPGGLNTQIQINNSGSFGGLPNATPGSVLASQGLTTPPTFQQKADYDTRDNFGSGAFVCNGTTYNTNAMAALLGAIGSATATIDFTQSNCGIGDVLLPKNVLLNFGPGGSLNLLTDNTTTPGNAQFDTTVGALGNCVPIANQCATTVTAPAQISGVGDTYAVVCGRGFTGGALTLTSNVPSDMILTWPGTSISFSSINQAWMVPSVVAGSHTFTATSSGNVVGACTATPIVGGGPTPWLDGVGGICSNVSANSPYSCTGAFQSGSFLLFFGSQNNSTETCSAATAGFTLLPGAAGCSTVTGSNLAVAYLNSAAAGSVTPTIPFNPSPAGHFWSAEVLGLRPSSARIQVLGALSNPNGNQIFLNATGNAGSVDFTGNLAPIKIRPEWWGASATASATINTAALRAAILAAFGTNRLNGSGLNQYNKELLLSQSYQINGELQLYHVLGPPPGARAIIRCENGGGITQTATNQRIFDMQSFAYADVHDCGFSTTASQDANHPLWDNDFNGTTTAGDLAPQFSTCYNCTFAGNGIAAIGLLAAKSGGSAQYSNEYCVDCEMASFTQACYQIGTPTSLATNALDIGYSGDMQGCPQYGLVTYGGGYVSISAGSNGISSMENGFSTQTGYDMAGSQMQGPCIMEHMRSESRKLISCSSVIMKDSRTIDQGQTITPGGSFPIGTIFHGMWPTSDGAYYQATVDSGPFVGAGSLASLLNASGGSATSITDTNDTIAGSVTIKQFLVGDSLTQATTGSTATVVVAGSSFATISGTLNSGTFQSGETATQATSGVTCTIFGSVTGTNFFCNNFSATPDNTHQWTGNTSGATFTPNGTTPSYSASTMIVSAPTGSPDGTHNWTNGSGATFAPSGTPVPQANWTANAFVGMRVGIFAGTNVKCYGVVTANTSQAMTLSGGWVTNFPFTVCTAPDSTSTFATDLNWNHGTITNGGMTLAYMNENVIAGDVLFPNPVSAGRIEDVTAAGGQVFIGQGVTISNLATSRADWYNNTGGGDPQQFYAAPDWDVRPSPTGTPLGLQLSWSFPAIAGAPFAGGYHRNFGATKFCWNAGTVGTNDPPANTSANEICAGGRSDRQAGTDSFRNRFEIPGGSIGGIGPAVPTGVDQNGVDANILGGDSTGAGNPGGINFRIASAGSSGPTPNSGTTRGGVDNTGLSFTTDGSFNSKQKDGASACEISFGTTTLNTGGTTTSTGLSCLPANSIIDAVVYRITTTITTAANFTIGDGVTAARFCSTQSTLAAGTTGTCLAQSDQTGAAGPKQVNAASVVVTTNVNPGAGAIRLIVYYHTWTAPTS